VKLKLRDYQLASIRGDSKWPGVWNFLYRDNHFAGMVVLPTGSGKTFTAVTFCEALMAKRKKEGDDVRVIWIAHRDELIEQAAEAFRKINPKAYMTTWIGSGKKVTLDSGEVLSGPKDAHGDVILAMINSSKKLPDAIDIVAHNKGCTYVVVIDEAHHYAVGHEYEGAYSNMYKRLMAKLRRLKHHGKKTVEKLVGLSATPERLDKRPLGFDGIAYRTTFLDLVRRGYLAKPRLYEMRSNFYAKLDVRGGEFTQQSLERLNTPTRNAAIAKEIISNRWRYGKTLVFCCTRKHCRDMGQALDQYAGEIGVDIDFRIIDGTNTKLERQEIRAWLDHGPPREFKILLNCMVYTEGFDAPTLNSVVLARPTMSETLWMQMVGRGARIVKARAVYPTSYFSSYPAVGESGMFVKTKDPTSQAYGKTVELIPGSTPKIMVERSIKDTFNLTVVSDDITRFATLLKDWELHISPESADDDEFKRRRRRKQRVKEIQETQTAVANRVEGKLAEAQLVSVQGILVVSTLFYSRIGIPLDEDRMDSIRALNEFAKGCWIDYVDHKKGCHKPADSSGKPLCTCKKRKIFDKDMFNQSYTYCVTNGQIPFQVWQKIQWAYYLHHIRNLQWVLDDNTRKSVRTYHWVPVTTITDEMRKQSRLRVNKDLAQAQTTNAGFNAEYSSRDKIMDLYSTVLRHALKMKHTLATVSVLNEVHRRVKRISARDRRLVLRTDVVMNEEKDPWIRKLFVFRETMSEAMQQILNDSCCMVQAVGLNSKLSENEAFEFRPGGKHDRAGSGNPLPDGQLDA
jgi:superfamily II DNA or RNA helicase